jgi:hypothetical protein
VARAEAISFADYILFYEYFHGDNGAGLGASHQTGWTGIIARTLDLFARLNPADMLETGMLDLVARITREQVGEVAGGQGQLDLQPAIVP